MSPLAHTTPAQRDHYTAWALRSAAKLKVRRDIADHLRKCAEAARAVGEVNFYAGTPGAVK